MQNFARRLALALVLSGSAFAAQAQVVISQVYGGGGNTGAQFKSDFIELHNNGTTSASLAGWSVQYTSAAGTGTWTVTPLSGSIAPGGYYLVKQADGTGTQPALPTPDATGTIPMSGSAGKVALSNSTTAFSGMCPTGNVDLVGFGPTATCSETSPTAVLSSSTAALRANSGCTDTGNNSTDFTVVAPNPRNSATSAFSCGAALPSISIANTSVTEGNSGTSNAVFTVTLSQPAGVGGVTFNIGNFDDTAVDASDYINQDLTGQTIAAGAVTYQYTVLVNGDTDAELDETFFARISAVSGATLGDVEAIGTIINDDATPPPTLSIADLTIDEGATGTKTAAFTVQLSSPAPAGGVTFDIATTDDTATTADNDYLANALTGQTIPAGSSTYAFNVTVNSDTTVESNESFLVNVTNVTGATVGDGQARATIVNDDFTITPIHDIQGSGATSPIVNQSVTTVGIVTGRKSNGFFLQAADIEADANAATSEGVFVFTSTAPPVQATVGNRVRVAGTVVEFIPTADLGQLPLTEISNATVIELSTGNAMPTPVQLTTTFPNPANPALDQLEPVEGMRVTAASFTVVAPTRGSTNETNATGTSNGQINLVVTGVARPLCEPGIQNPDPAPVPGGGSFPPLPRWDFNPELMFSDTDGLIGGTRLDLAAGATLTNYVGPMDYGFRRYSIYPDPAITPTVVNATPTAARLPTATEFTVASYNLERFFDTVNDPATGEPVLTPIALANRLNKASLGIRNFLNTPDVLGVIEVENLSVLQQLAAKINADAVTAGQPDPQYVAYLEEGNDIGGIDNGLLVKSAEVAAAVDRVEVLAVTQQGKTTVLTNPDASTDLLNDRPPLQLDALVHFADGRKFPITAIVVHQRSLSSAGGNDATGERVRNKRQKQAEYLAGLVQGMQTADPDRHITVLGDFNAFEFNDGLGDSMAVTTGMAFADNTTVVPGDGADLVTPDLLNLASEETPDQRYSFVFDGNAQSLDHILINQELGANVAGFDLDHARINADFPEINRNDANSASRLADHDPAVAYFVVANADLAVTASATPATVPVGGAMTFNATVSNLGPDGANFPGVGFAFDAELADLGITAPSGWTCDAPVVGSGQSSVACASMTALANAGSAMFQLTATAPSNEVGNAINMTVVTTSQTEDPNLDNNDASASVSVTAASVDLSLRLNTLARWYRPSDRIDFQIPVRSSGPDAASLPVLVLTANIPNGVASVTFMAPPAWTCVRILPSPSGTYEGRCTRNAAMAVGSVEYINLFMFAPATFTETYLNVTTQVSSAGTELTPANNVATRNIPRR